MNLINMGYLMCLGLWPLCQIVQYRYKSWTSEQSDFMFVIVLYKMKKTKLTHPNMSKINIFSHKPNIDAHAVSYNHTSTTTSDMWNADICHIFYVIYFPNIAMSSIYGPWILQSLTKLIPQDNHLVCSMKFIINYYTMRNCIKFFICV